VADEHGLHASFADDTELDAQPLHVFVAGFVFVCAAIDAGVGVEEVAIDTLVSKKCLLPSFGTH
jgi:hypothetical protein